MNGECFVLFGMGMKMQEVVFSGNGVRFHDNGVGFGLAL